jgi:nucleoid DNA-binding protein
MIADFWGRAAIRLTIDLDAGIRGIYTGNHSKTCRANDLRLLSSGIAEETEVVTKKEIVKTISEEIGLTQLKTKEIVQKTFDAIVETLVEDGRIELRNFGVFEVKKRAARKARNPRTGQRVDVPEKFVVTFKPGKEMEERVKILEAEKAAAEARQAAASAMRQPPLSDAPTAPTTPAAPVDTSMDASSGFANPGGTA